MSLISNDNSDSEKKRTRFENEQNDKHKEKQKNQQRIKTKTISELQFNLIDDLSSINLDSIEDLSQLNQWQFRKIIEHLAYLNFSNNEKREFIKLQEIYFQFQEIEFDNFESLFKDINEKDEKYKNIIKILNNNKMNIRYTKNRIKREQGKLDKEELFQISKNRKRNYNYDDNDDNEHKRKRREYNDNNDNEYKMKHRDY